MRRSLMLPLAVLAALLVAATAGASAKTVQITKNGFVPATQTIVAGDTITWHNADTAQHQVVADDGSFASAQLKSDGTYSFTFQKAGKFTYHDADVKTQKGTITVTAPAASVTLTPPVRTVSYGSDLTLSGSVTNQLTSEPVTLTSQPSSSLKATTTSASGAFSFTVAPTSRTVYTAHWRTSDSPSVTVNVAPRVGFGHSGRIYTVKVTSDISYSGHYVWAQKRNATGGWHNLRRVFLGGNSNARFTLELARGRSVLRLALPAPQAGADYVASLSRQLVIVKK
ncbi:MAG: cupredoxin domain-containing protein [Gaiellaceae bacterium]